MSAQIRHILDDANMDDEDIMRIMSIVEKQEEKLQEKSMKLYDLSRENGELREACMKKYAVKIPDDVQKEIDEAYETKEYVDYLKKENEKLKETIHKQGDRLAIYTAKEEKPHTPSSACAHAVLEIKNDEIGFLKEENKKLKEKLTSIQGEIKDVLKEEEKLCEKDDY